MMHHLSPVVGARNRSAFAPLLAALLLCAGVGCAEGPPEPEGPKPHVAEYTVRARVEALPDPERPAAEFLAHHEPIPSFRATWPDGPLGMDSMVMPFPPAEGVSLADIEQGDVVEITFAVTYDGDTGAVDNYEMIRIEPLPPDTELTFGTVEDAEEALETQPNVGDADADQAMPDSPPTRGEPGSGEGG